MEVRCALAERELAARGLIRGRYPAGMRLVLWLFPGQKAPFYGDYGRYGLQLGVLFGIPMTLILLGISFLDDDLPLGGFLGLGLLAGAAFGMISMLMKSVHRRMKLTPWDELGRRTPGAIPAGAERYDEIAADFVRRPWTAGLKDHFGRRGED